MSRSVMNTFDENVPSIWNLQIMLSPCKCNLYEKLDIFVMEISHLANCTFYPKVFFQILPFR